MAGLTAQTPRPTEIKLHQKSRELEISFDNARSFRFSCEYLRVFSPSAEVRGHGADFWKLAHRYPKAERAIGFLIAKSGDDLDEE